MYIKYTLKLQYKCNNDQIFGNMNKASKNGPALLWLVGSSSLIRLRPLTFWFNFIARSENCFYWVWNQVTLQLSNEPNLFNCFKFYYLTYFILTCLKIPVYIGITELLANAAFRDAYTNNTITQTQLFQLLRRNYS